MRAVREIRFRVLKQLHPGFVDEGGGLKRMAGLMAQEDARELHDLGDALSGTAFKVFADALAGGGVVRGINAGPRELARSDLDVLTELAKQHGATGLL